MSAKARVPKLKTLGRYNIERTIGKGAMGVVYEGVDPRLGRRVAIKTILKSHLDADTAKEYSMRFVREAQAVARLNHPNIVQVYDFGEEGDIAYLVMEFIKGKELKAVFDANERFDLKEAVRIMGELCDALDFAHDAGIIHRDIKPANVMIDAQGRTKLTDFGVARVQDSDKSSIEHTQAGTMVGTPAYMSPEQITGGNIDKRSDVFSAGIVLYQCLTGEKPFTGSGAWTIAKKIIQEEPALPSSLNNAVTPLFDAVVNKALSKNPDTRYQSARDLGIALKRALQGKGEEDDADTTVTGELSHFPGVKPAAAAARARVQASPRASSGPAVPADGGQEIELEFWRAIKDGNEPEDFELYVQQFPDGIYAALAKRKIAKLRGMPMDESRTRAKEQEKREQEHAARREAEVKNKLEAEKARLEAEMARREEEYKRREAEAEAKRAAEKARLEAEQQKREAETEAKRQALEKVRQEAEERTRKEAEARAKREAEEKEKRDAESKARAEADARQKAEFAKREADLKTRAADTQSTPGGKRQAIGPLVGIVIAALAGAYVYHFGGGDEWTQQQIVAIQKQLAQATKGRDDAPKSGELAKRKALAAAPRKAESEAARAAVAPADPAARGGASLFQTATTLEDQGKGADAVKAYIKAADGGSCEAARRLGDIFDKGLAGFSRNYNESLRWYNFARTLGTCEVPVANSRS